MSGGRMMLCMLQLRRVSDSREHDTCTQPPHSGSHHTFTWKSRNVSVLKLFLEILEPKHNWKPKRQICHRQPRHIPRHWCVFSNWPGQGCRRQSGSKVNKKKISRYPMTVKITKCKVKELKCLAAQKKLDSLGI